MSNKFSVPRGTADILPLEALLWQKLEEISRTVLKNYNYKEIRTPLFEETELFARSMGKTSDVVLKQMLNLASQRPNEDGSPKLSGLSLRPESTASVVRSYIENNLDKKELISKFYYIGPMFRGERPQKGRLRQFHQIGAEVIGPGATQPYIDAEVIILCVELLKAFNIEGYQLTLNTLGDPEDKENFSKILRGKIKGFIGEFCEDCRDRFKRNVFRILDCKNKDCQKTLSKIEINDSYLSKESRERYTKVKEALAENGIDFIESYRMVRGLDYYNHTVFEFTHDGLGSQNAIGAGGRYNNLVGYLGGENRSESGIGGIGFSFGLERLILALGDQQKEMALSIDSYIIPMDEECYKKAFGILTQLRRNSISSDMNYQLSSMKSQMRSANKYNASFVVILGEDEIKNESVTLKDMKENLEEKVSIKDGDLGSLISKIKEGTK